MKPTMVPVLHVYLANINNGRTVVFIVHVGYHLNFDIHVMSYTSTVHLCQ